MPASSSSSSPKRPSSFLNVCLSCATRPGGIHLGARGLGLVVGKVSSGADPSKLHWMILSLSHSPDAQQGRGMASHGQGGCVQYGTRAHSAPKPQETPSHQPATSPTAASADRSTRPITHTQGARARHNRDQHKAPRAPWLAQRQDRIPSRAPTLL